MSLLRKTLFGNESTNRRHAACCSANLRRAKLGSGGASRLEFHLLAIHRHNASYNTGSCKEGQSDPGHGALWMAFNSQLRTSVSFPFSSRALPPAPLDFPHYSIPALNLPQKECHFRSIRSRSQATQASIISLSTSFCPQLACRSVINGVGRSYECHPTGSSKPDGGSASSTRSSRIWEDGHGLGWAWQLDI